MDATGFKLNTRRTPGDGCLAFGSFSFMLEENAFDAMKTASVAAEM